MPSFEEIPQSKSEKGSEEGELYERLCLAILAKRGYDISKEEENFCDFSVGREVKLGTERKFDDVVFKYKDQDEEKNLIFVQVKHKQDDYEINSEILFTEASIAKDIWNDHSMRKDFNLQQYFISYLSVREHLQKTTSEKLRNGVMKYVVIFTNVGLNTEELKNKGCMLKEPDKIITFFNLNDWSSQTRQSDHCTQFVKISERFYKILKRSSDKDRLATELAKFVEENKIMGIDVPILKCYHVALATDILKISEEKKDNNFRFRVAEFQESFFKKVITGSKKEFREALFKAIRKLDESKNSKNDDELIKILKKINWRAVPNFGQIEAQNEIYLPREWKTINHKDMKELATELAKFVVSKKIMGISAALLHNYHKALAKDILKISEVKKNKNGAYREAEFQDKFLEKDITGSEKKFRNALFEAIRELDESMRGKKDDDLIKILKEINWRAVPNFGQNEINLPGECKMIKELATELAKFVVSKKIMGIGEALLHNYHKALAKDILKISEVKKNKNGTYREAKFQDEFLEKDITGSKKELREAIFKTIKQLDKENRDKLDEELTETLRNTKWRVVEGFGKSKPQDKIPDCLPSQWTAIKKDSVDDFLKYLVFIVNQPRVKDLETCLISSARETVVKDISLSHVLDKIVHAGSGFYNYIKNRLGGHKQKKNKEEWICGGEIVNFFEQQIQFIISFLVTNMTLLYENEVMQYVNFNNYGDLNESVKRFLGSNKKILCVKTSVTLFSAIKVMQSLDNETGRISVCFDSLQWKENRDYVFISFKSDSNNLLIIECRHAVNQIKKEEFYKKLSEIYESKTNKKVILIMQQDMCVYLTKKFRNDFRSKGLFLFEEDSININDFEPKENPSTKKVLVFQKQNERLSLNDLNGINSWDSYKDYISEERFQSNQDAIDLITLLKILRDEEIEIGNKPLVTSDLEGAYAVLDEEINTRTLADKISQDSDNMYIISGINESDETGKIDRLNQCLGLGSESNVIENQIRDVNGDGKIQIADDMFKEKNFKETCHNFPERRIFWISLRKAEYGTRFILQQLYNPEFYLKRKFKKVIINKDIKGVLEDKNLSEIFIFHCTNGHQGIIDFFEITNQDENEQFENNRKNSKIKLFSSLSNAEAAFQEHFGKNQLVHWLKVEEKQIVWVNSHGSVNSLRKYLDKEKSEVCLVEEENLVKEIKDRKVVIIAGDPGMGKTTTLTKLYESKYENVKLLETNWVININLIDHLQAIKDIAEHKDKLDVFDVVNFLSKVDSKLNHNLAKRLLKLAILDKNKTFAKPILLTFDEFDQVVDEEDRKKIISLLRFLKNETAVKFWIATRQHCRETLENELSTFAIEFDPMNDYDNLEYVNNYIIDRTFFTSTEEEYAEVFFRDNGVNYAKNTLKKITSFFKNDTFRIIGIPLQLYLMLEVCIHNVCNRMNNDMESPNFNYIWEVNQKIINRKYDIFFKKADFKNPMQKTREKLIFERFHKDLAKSKIKKVSPNFSDKDKAFILSFGIIIPQGNGIEFIHSTFEDFFKAKVFVDWIKEEPSNFSSLSKQKYLLSEVLLKPDYKRIRVFLNVELRNVKKCGELIKNLLLEKPFNEVKKLLEVADFESNTHIVRLLSDCLDY